MGGTVWDTVADAEEIRDELLKIVYGIWDHIKNGGDHGADTLALEWVGFLPGKRESRRVLGDYVLKEQDLLAGRVFPDAVGYGGWHIDSHPPERFRCIAAKTEESEDLPVHLPGLYTIPYRSLYARGVENLLLGGRIISATHRAFASTRVMGTCAVLAQAAGTAAWGGRTGRDTPGTRRGCGGAAAASAAGRLLHTRRAQRGSGRFGAGSCRSVFLRGRRVGD